jgi:hypothetical protein
VSIPITSGPALAAAENPKVELVPLSSVRPAQENDNVYSSMSLDDPDMQDLIKSINDHGLLEPIHLSSDGVIISGHRRRFASYMAGLEQVPVIRHSVSYQYNREDFLRLLVEANTQRKKTAGMLIREAAMKIDPEQAHRQIKIEQLEQERERRFESGVSGQTVDSKNIEERKKISDAKMPLLKAALDVINEHSRFWPLSVRQVHYRLLGPNAPLKHASKPGSRYVNDKASYKSLCELLARGRIEGHVPWESIDDETRPQDLNNHYWNPADFLQDQLRRFLKGYFRNRQQSQYDHIEIIAEKLTVRTILSGVARKYSIPLTINRGMSGPTVKKKIYDRYDDSGKENLVLLVVSDLDPAGDAIAQDIRDAFERDFGIDECNLEVYKVALNIDQVREMELQPSMDAKETSPTYKEFVERYGMTEAFELEALEPADLQHILENAIEDVMDMDAYREELKQEQHDSAGIVAAKQMVSEFMKTVSLESGTSPAFESEGA